MHLANQDSSILLAKYGHFWLQKNKTVTVKMPNLRLQNGSPQTSGWCHGGYVMNVSGYDAAAQPCFQFFPVATHATATKNYSLYCIFLSHGGLNFVQKFSKAQKSHFWMTSLLCTSTPRATGPVVHIVWLGRWHDGIFFGVCARQATLIGLNRRHLWVWYPGLTMHPWATATSVYSLWFLHVLKQ